MPARRAALLALLGLALLAPLGGAEAHALLLRSVPEANAELASPPAAIDLWFSEPLEQALSKIRLLDARGDEVQTGAVTFDPSDPGHMGLPLGQLTPGIYTVAWQTLSKVDGHDWYGSYAFTVLNPDGSRPSSVTAILYGAPAGELPTPAQTAGRWLSLIGGMLMFSVPLFLLVVVRPGAPGGARPIWDLAAGPAVGVVSAAVLILLAGDWLLIGLQALRFDGLASVPGLVLGTRAGVLTLAREALALGAALVVLTQPGAAPLTSRERARLLLVQIGLGAVLGGLVLGALRGGATVSVPAALAVAAGSAWALRSPDDPSAAAGRRAWGAALFLGAAGLLTYSSGSHADAVSGWVWAVLGDYLHVLSAGAWVGGLLLLAALLWRARREASPEGRTALPPLVERFSYLASFSVFVLATTGVLSALVQFPNLVSLWTSTYGRVLLVKIAVLAGALGIAFLNNRLVHGRRARLEESANLARLNRNALVESLVVSAAMVVVAVLVQTPTPRSLTPATQAVQVGMPFNTIARGDDLNVHLQVAPNRVGVNRFWVHLYHDDGSPIGEVQLVRMIFQSQRQGIGQAEADLRPLGQDTFAVQGTYVGQPGAWDLSVYVRRRGVDDVIAKTRLDVPSDAPGPEERGPWASPAPGLPGGLLLGGALLSLGLIPFLWREVLRRVAWIPSGIAPVLGGTLLAAGVVLSGLSLPALFQPPEVSVNPASRTNPIPPTADSLAQGKALYAERCQICHGPEGLGDGPLGVTLNPRPANLQVHMVAGVHTDGQIFEWITDGFPNSSMPAFGDTLTEEERWHILNYIRTLVPEENP